MSRHRDVRRLDIDNEMSEDVFGRSLEDDEPLPSPGAAQYYYDRGVPKDSASLFSYITPQKPSSGKKGKKQRQRSNEGQGDPTLPVVAVQVEGRGGEEAVIEQDDEEEVALVSGKQYIQSLLGDAFSEEDIVEALQTCDLNAEVALNALLTQRSSKPHSTKETSTTRGKSLSFASQTQPSSKGAKGTHKRTNVHTSSMSVPSSVSKLPIETGSGEAPSHGGYGGVDGHHPKGGRVGTQNTPVEAVTASPVSSSSGTTSLSELMKQAPSTTSPSGSTSLSELMKQAPSTTSPSGSTSLSELMKKAPSTTGPSGATSLSELMKQAPSTTSPSGSTSLSELMKQAPSTTGPSGSTSLSELMKKAPSTTSPSGATSLSELMKQAPSTTSPSGATSLSELMKQAPSTTGPSGSTSLSELMKKAPSTASPSGSASLSELMKQAPSTTSSSGGTSLSELMKQAPSATNPSGSTSLSELMKKAPSTTGPSGGTSLSELMKQTPSTTSSSGVTSLSELMKQQHAARKQETETPQVAHRSGSKASSSSLIVTADHMPTPHLQAAAVNDSMTLADLMKQMDTNTRPGLVTTQFSNEDSGDSSLVTPSHYSDNRPMGDVHMGDFPSTSTSHASGWSDSDRGLPSSITSLQQHGGSKGFPTSSMLSHDSHMMLSTGGRVEYTEDHTPRAVTMDAVFRSVAKAISSTVSGGKNSSLFDFTKGVAVVPLAEPSSCALVVSRCCYSRCVNHSITEAAILKSFVRDWTSGKTTVFSFSTPSPDDVILSSRKEYIRQHTTH